jgi:hypothetical protein
MKRRNKSLMIGVAVGALLGAVLALIATEGYEEASASEDPVKALGVGDYLALGISLLSLARQFGAMLKRA